MPKKFAVTENFLNGSSALTPRDAVAAIIINEDKKVLLQLRDDKENIFFANHWGCFGGAIEPEEGAEKALIRELHEEIGIEFDKSAVMQFITFSFNPTPDYHVIDRFFFVVETSNQVLQKLKLGEGSMYGFFTFEEMMKIPNLVPYDRFGLWLYFNQYRFFD